MEKNHPQLKPLTHLIHGYLRAQRLSAKNQTRKSSRLIFASDLCDFVNRELPDFEPYFVRAKDHVIQAKMIIRVGVVGANDPFLYFIWRDSYGYGIPNEQVAIPTNYSSKQVGRALSDAPEKIATNLLISYAELGIPRPIHNFDSPRFRIRHYMDRYRLTPKQGEVLHQLVLCLELGEPKSAAAKRMKISVNTIDGHVTIINRQLNSSAWMEAAIVAEASWIRKLHHQESMEKILEETLRADLGLSPSS